MKDKFAILMLMVLASTPAFGDDVPDELIGYFGNSPVQCRSFHTEAILSFASVTGDIFGDRYNYR
ncbi:hypothetical protein ACN2CC_32610 [Mesorhizobium muleiense]|uniref:hypothetical protein n=1 Tax=Mesorhizobium muleiense TaxID=1004279 RepID=UPI003AFB1993